MKKYAFLAAAPCALASPVMAAIVLDAPHVAKHQTPPKGDKETKPTKVVAQEVFSTGVAKGRDRLDSATSTSALKGSDIEVFGARSLAEVLRNIPGIRTESAGGEGNGSYTIRGLPLASSGSKFMQLQEDGLPVLEFADIFTLSPDIFMRADLNLAAVEAIRGGSASTFASNSPGGVINLISKNGDVEGGAIQVTEGVNYGEHRLDADYGGKLSETLRFHIGGFYRQGEGPRHAGYDAYKGGQAKFNITKQFANGYIRLNAKLLDDHTPFYQVVPLRVTGTDANPKFVNVANFDVRRDATMSPNIKDSVFLDRRNKLSKDNVQNGMHPIEKAVGLESQFDFGEWTITEKFRYASMSGKVILNQPLAVGPASVLTNVFGGAGAHLSFASGPNAGQVIADPSTLNGNGLLTVTALLQWRMNSLDNATNDLRATRMWKIGKGTLTATAGFYKSLQSIDTDWLFSSVLTDVRGGGETALLNITSAAGVPITQNGFSAYGVGFANGGYHRATDVDYRVNAPYGSLNYHVGRLALGGSLRYDFGSARGTLYGAELGGGRVGSTPYDVNGDGVISGPENDVSILPLGQPGAVDYRYHYLSYSVGANFRVAEPLAFFARYSRGARAAADRILFSPAIIGVDGKLIDPADGFDSVRQAELGMKFRKSGVTINLTAFSAKTGDRNTQVNAAPDGSVQLEHVIRTYSAKGVEFEGGARHGRFSVTVGATYTSAKIDSDVTHPDFVGNLPRHQPKLIFQATPQFTTEHLTVGANVVGNTSSYAQDSNQLKMPGYTLVNAFVQIRPVERVQLMLNVNNLFDKVAITEITQPTIPAGGIVYGRAMLGRTVSGSLRYSF